MGNVYCIAGAGSYGQRDRAATASKPCYAGGVFHDESRLNATGRPVTGVERELLDAASRSQRGYLLRQAALIAGLGYLLMPTAYVEFLIYPKVVIPTDIEQTMQNIVAHNKLFLAAILGYLVTSLLDVVIAWALYVLLVPVNRAISLLTAWFRLIYIAIALFGLLNLITVFRLLATPDYLTAFGSGPLHAQVKLLLNAFRYDWSFSLIVFGVHLVLLGWLIYRSAYIPKIIGILLVINGLGWCVDSLRPYLYPTAKLGFVFATFFGELIFMLWLLIRGWQIREPFAEQ
jgi:hypothetical protein